MGIVSEEVISQALNGVMDPHMKASINEIGMVRRITVTDANDVDIGLSFPCIGCPARELIQSDIVACVGRIDGVRNVKVSDEWVNKWNPDDISDRARENAREAGYLL